MSEMDDLEGASEVFYLIAGPTLVFSEGSRYQSSEDIGSVPSTSIGRGPCVLVYGTCERELYDRSTYTSTPQCHIVT